MVLYNGLCTLERGDGFIVVVLAGEESVAFFDVKASGTVLSVGVRISMSLVYWRSKFIDFRRACTFIL